MNARADAGLTGFRMLGRLASLQSGSFCQHIFTSV